MPRPKRWKYFSENVAGNLHDATRFLNDYHPDWDVVVMHYVGSITIIVHRVEVFDLEE